ncbi:MAG TPA: AtpZ/AtpI family protein [Methylovirgula sp.]|jgi:ATP synthase protein I|nr:AtpZ/AtpI family protein [Methylovirgula sp.]
MAQNMNSGGRDDANKDAAGQDAARETPDDAALRARLDTLSSRLDARQKDAGTDEDSVADLSGSSLGKAMNLGFRVLAEFVAAVGVGTLIGWQLDAWFHTGPILLIVFLILGTAAGFLNIYRLAAGPTGPKRG